MPNPRRPLPLLLLVLLAGTSLAAFAQPQHRERSEDPPEQTRQHETRQPRERRSMPIPSPRTRQERRHEHDDALSDSIRRIERRTRGQVLSAERVPYDGRNLNRIKVVDANGRVRVYMDDPQDQNQPAAPTRGDDD